jgi:hypothetical protein
MLFIGFSSFLIVSAVILVALLFRLKVERRVAEVGLLLALGFTTRTVAMLLLIEGGILVLIGGLLGLLGGGAFAWFMLEGLRSWWSAAVQTPLLRLHLSAATAAIGYAGSILVALLAIAWGLRGVTRLPVRALLAGTATTAGVSDLSRFPGTNQRWSSIVAVAAALMAVAAGITPLVTDAVGESLGFFCSGMAMLVACLAFVARCMHRSSRRAGMTVRRPGLAALLKLGARNIPRHRGRSLMTIGLVASATFVIASVEAFRIKPEADLSARHSGTGGFALIAESAAPIYQDLSTQAGREELGIPADALPAGTSFMPFRVRPGEETSCLNLYRPTSPRILGATPAMIQRGGFVFSGAARLDALTAAETGTDNPWELLTVRCPDGAVPVIGDEAAVKWQLHSGLGKDLAIHDERGRAVTLRFVALLKGSALQGELIVAESRFVELFPSRSGYRFFLIGLPWLRADGKSAARRVPAADAAAVGATLESALTAFGFDVSSTVQRLADYSAVQNTYLSTFQTLGGLGLILGTFGLAAVLLRNVWERRAELALMRALGFSRRALGWMVLSENAALVAAGLACGIAPAAVAVAPQVMDRAATIPWWSLLLTLLGVMVVGMAGGAVALIPTLRAPLLNALRTE